MRQAITTKYLAPTNHKGARIKAECAGGKIVMPWDHAHNPERNHHTAAKWLLRKMQWHEKNAVIGGAMPNGGYCFVLVDKDTVEREGNEDL